MSWCRSAMSCWSTRCSAATSCSRCSCASPACTSGSCPSAARSSPCWWTGSRRTSVLQNGEPAAGAAVSRTDRSDPNNWCDSISPASNRPTLLAARFCPRSLGLSPPDWRAQWHANSRVHIWEGRRESVSKCVFQMIERQYKLLY